MVGAAVLGVIVGKPVGASVTGVQDCPMVKHISPDGHSRGVLRPFSSTITGQGMASGLVLHSSVAFCHPLQRKKNAVFLLEQIVQASHVLCSNGTYLPQNMFDGLSIDFLKANSSSVGAGVGTTVAFVMLGARVALVSFKAIEGASVEFESTETEGEGAIVALVSLEATEGAKVVLDATEGAKVLLLPVSFPVALDGDIVSFPGAIDGAIVSFPAIDGELVVPLPSPKPSKSPRLKEPTFVADSTTEALQGKSGPKQ